MKKLFLMAACIAVGSFVSCSNDDVVTPPAGGGEQDKAPILFSVGGANIDVTTRGTGAVGDLSAEDGGNNIWRGEKLNVYMFDKSDFSIAKDVYGDIFNNAEITAPTADAASNVGYAEYGDPKYYPMAGNYSFFAYHADDAAKDGATPELNVDGDKYVLPLVLDGTQDLMVSKADMSDAQRDALTAQGYDATRYYSAYSARKKVGYNGQEDPNGVQPHFVFQHLLSRLAFFVQPSSEVVSDQAIAEDGTYTGVTIDSVKIVNAKTEANLIVAWDGETAPDEYLTDITAEDVVALKERDALETTETGALPLVELTPIQPKWDVEENKAITSRIGESLMLIPQETYDLEIYISQTPRAGGEKYTSVYPQTLRVPSGANFEAGKQYNITFTVYGVEKIVVTLELAPWEKGEDIAVDNDKIDEEDNTVDEGTEEDNENLPIE